MNAIVEIEAESSDPKRPYLNLVPIVDALVTHGNELVDGGFRLTQGGWDCVLAQPIDFDLIGRTFRLPPTIDGSAETDEILDRKSWCAIVGGKSLARTTRLRASILRGSSDIRRR